MRHGVRKGTDLENLGFAKPKSPEEEKREDLDTARLVSEAQAGDRDSFGVLYSRYLDRVFGYMLVVLADQPEAEDATQHVFAKALEALPGYEQRTQPFRAWLFTIARNHAVDQLRRLARIMPIDPSELRELQEERELTAEEDDLLAVLSWLSDSDLSLFVERLTLAQRRVLMLRFTADFTTAEIAQILGRSAADVRMLQSRALQFLRDRLNALARRADLSDAVEDSDKIQMRRAPKEAPVIRSRKWSIHKKK